MYVLRIGHRVPDFESWKKLFDSDPLGREKSGVVRYKVMRPTDDKSRAIVDLELASREQAEGLATRLRELWSGMPDQVIDPLIDVVEIVESREFGVMPGRRAA
jgi:hypothetical protein